MDILTFRITELAYILGAFGLLWLLRHLAPNLIRFWQNRNYKGLAVASLSVVIAVIAIWYLVSPLIPPSDKTVHREGTHWGLESICKTAPICTDCESGSNCAVCESRAGCLEAVDKYADSCFNSLYDHWGVISRADFASLLNTCINERSGHKSIRTMTGEP